MTCNFRVAGNKLHLSKKRKQKSTGQVRPVISDIASTVMSAQCRSFKPPTWQCYKAYSCLPASLPMLLIPPHLTSEPAPVKFVPNSNGSNISLTRHKPLTFFLDDTLYRQRNKHWEEEMHYNDCNLTRWFIDVWKQLWIVFECLFVH